MGICLALAPRAVYRFHRRCARRPLAFRPGPPRYSTVQDTSVNRSEPQTQPCVPGLWQIQMAAHKPDRLGPIVNGAFEVHGCSDDVDSFIDPGPPTT